MRPGSRAVVEPSILVALITVGGTLLGGAGWLFRNLLKDKDAQIEHIQEELAECVKECEGERERSEAWQDKYVNLLIADIEERKGRDRTFDLLAKAAQNSGREV